MPGDSAPVKKFLVERRMRSGQTDQSRAARGRRCHNSSEPEERSLSFGKKCPANTRRTSDPSAMPIGLANRAATDASALAAVIVPAATGHPGALKARRSQHREESCAAERCSTAQHPGSDSLPSKAVSFES